MKWWIKDKPLYRCSPSSSTKSQLDILDILHSIVQEHRLESKHYQPLTERIHHHQRVFINREAPNKQ